MSNLKVFGIVGWRNNGKTTLIEKLVSEFVARGLSVSTVKHAHHGFDIDDKAVRRAGLDYWKDLDLVIWESFDAYLAKHPIGKNAYMGTTKTDNLYFNAPFKKGDHILFGSETKGLDEKGFPFN